MEQNKQEKTVEQIITEFAVKYLYDLTTDDNGTLEWVLEQTGVSEFELMNGFENLGQDLGIDLDAERWEK
jgi:hypothetical protein